MNDIVIPECWRVTGTFNIIFWHLFQHWQFKGTRMTHHSVSSKSKCPLVISIVSWIVPIWVIITWVTAFFKDPSHNVVSVDCFHLSYDIQWPMSQCFCCIFVLKVQCLIHLFFTIIRFYTKIWHLTIIQWQNIPCS